MKTVTVFIKQTQHHQEMLAGGMNIVSGENVAAFSQKLLVNLKTCLRSVMISQMEKSQLRKALLSSRARAEVLQNIVQVGDKVLVEVSKGNSTEGSEWSQMREAFMAMLDA